MTNNTLLVVSDKFAKFATHKDVVTLSEFHANFIGPLDDCCQQRILLIPGQGLCSDDIEALLRQVAESPLSNYFDMSLWHQRPHKIARIHTHKKFSKNTLISEPVRTGADVFEMELIIDEDCELMQDHQTGEHVQGMILIEAARQSVLAVTEEFFPPQRGNRHAFILGSLSVDYHNFVFPLGANLIYRIRNKDLSKTNRQQFEVEVCIKQCGIKVVTCVFVFSSYEKKIINRREHFQASQALMEYVQVLNQEEVMNK